MPIECIHRKGVTDVTYLLFGELTLYLSTIIDASNREIISYIISELQTLTLDLRKLKRAGRGRKVEMSSVTQIKEVFYIAKEFKRMPKKKQIFLFTKDNKSI